ARAVVARRAVHEHGAVAPVLSDDEIMRGRQTDVAGLLVSGLRRFIGWQRDHTMIEAQGRQLSPVAVFAVVDRQHRIDSQPSHGAQVPGLAIRSRTTGEPAGQEPEDVVHAGTTLRHLNYPTATALTIPDSVTLGDL